MADKKIRVKLIKGLNGRSKKHQACVRGLGIRRIHQTVEVADTPENRGMINHAYYMLEWESI